MAFVCSCKKESIVNSLTLGMGNPGLKCPDIYFVTYFAHVNREVGAFFFL